MWFQYLGAELTALGMFFFCLRGPKKVYRGKAAYRAVFRQVIALGMLATMFVLVHQLAYICWRVPLPFTITLPEWLSRLVQTAGVIFFLFGLSINRWAFRTMQGWTLPPLSRAPDQEARLFDEGPYAITRNPMYLSYLALFIGIQLIAQSGLIFVAPLLAAIFQWWALCEEIDQAYIHGGAYYDYQVRVPRWFSWNHCAMYWLNPFSQYYL